MRTWLCLLLALLLVPLAEAHHKGGHEGGLISIDLGDDRDDDRDDRDDDRDDRDDDREEADSRAGQTDRGRDEGAAVGPAPGPCLALTVNATKSGNAVAWQGGQVTTIHRATGDGEFRVVHEAGPEEVLFMDRDLVKHESYRYMATTGAAADCPSVEVTAVPFMGHVAGAGAAGLAMVGYAWHRRP